MRHAGKLNKILILALFFLSASEAFADGNVIVRPTTPEEKAYILSTLENLKRAASALPPGWEMNYETPLVANDELRFPGQEAPIGVEFKMEMKRVEGIAERQAHKDKIEADNQANLQKMNGLYDKVREKQQEAFKAQQDGDRGAYEAAKAEMDSFQKQYDQLMESDQNPIKNVADADYELNRDTKINVRLFANLYQTGISGELAPLDVNGAVLALRRDSNDRNRPSRALLLFGDWKLEKYGEGRNQSVVARREVAKGDKLTKVFNLAVEVEADKDRLGQLAQAIGVEAAKPF